MPKKKKKGVHKLCFRLISYTQFQVFKPIIWGDKAQHDSQLNMMKPGLTVTVVWPKTNSWSNPLISNSASPHLITDTQIFSWAWSPNFGLWTPQTKKLFFQFEMHSMEPSFSSSSSSSSIYAWGPFLYFSTLIKHKLSWSPMLATKKIQLYHHNIKESFFMN